VPAGDVAPRAGEPLAETPEDWITYRHDSARSGLSPVPVAAATPEQQWTFKLGNNELPGPASAAGDLVFACGSGGSVRALEAATGKERWVFYTGGAVRFPPSIMDGRAFVGSCDGKVYALEARTGRLLWTFRAAPQERKICVRESLWSTWPVAGGVVAEDGMVFAGAGMLDTSGNHLYALDAGTGQVKWQNNSSRMDGNAKSWNLSMLSPLALGHGKLYAVTAGRLMVFDPRTGAQAKDVPGILTGGAGPALGGHGVGGILNYAVMDTEAIPENLRGRKSALVLPVAGKDFSIVAGPAGKGLVAILCFQTANPDTAAWKADLKLSSCDALMAAGGVVIAAGSSRKSGGNVPATPLEPAATSELAGFNLTDGRELWRLPLPSPAIPHGVIVNRAGGIVVALENGTLVCLRGL
jgi:outer membrane protein assembly factor BamB